MGVFHTGNQRFLRQGKIPLFNCLFQFLQICFDALSNEQIGYKIPCDCKNGIALNIQDFTAFFFYNQTYVKFPVQGVDGILAAGFSLSNDQQCVIIIHDLRLLLAIVFVSYPVFI